jgi:hypothetical protein
VGCCVEGSNYITKTELVNNYLKTIFNADENIWLTMIETTLLATPV